MYHSAENNKCIFHAFNLAPNVFHGCTLPSQMVTLKLFTVLETVLQQQQQHQFRQCLLCFRCQNLNKCRRTNNNYNNVTVMSYQPYRKSTHLMPKHTFVVLYNLYSKSKGCSSVLCLCLTIGISECLENITIK